jgi:hypothetical protein
MIKNPPSFIIALAIAGSMAVSCSSERAQEPGRYYNNADGFSVKFHPGWSVIEGDGIETALVEATSPWEDDLDEFSEHVTVDLEDLGSEPELEVYFAQLVEDQGEYLPAFRTVETGEITIDGVDARWFTFEFINDGHPMKAVGYTFIKDKRAYLIAGIAQAHQFMFYQGVFEQTARSFRFE